MFEVHVICPSPSISHYAKLKEMFRQRYQVFVEILGWDIPGVDHKSRLEMDAFDTDETVYLIVMRSEEVVGASRMRPTTISNMMADVFPELCTASPPKERNTWEWSRGHVKPSEPHQIRSIILDHIFVSGYEFAFNLGIEALTAQINASDLPRWLTRGLAIDILGPKVSYDGSAELLAIRHHINSSTLSRVRQQVGIEAQTLFYPKEFTDVYAIEPRS